MGSKIISVIILCGVLFLGKNNEASYNKLDASMSVSEVLFTLGDMSLKEHMPDMTIKGVSAEKGKEIITQGYTQKPSGGRSTRISKHFVCTSCHNIEREDPDLMKHDPELRLKYTNEKGIPFLQGTTFYGLADRISFYNGDYKKKYGEVVDKARNNIREAIQLCSTECSQGRRMKKWEVESVLAYFKTIEIKIEDLDMGAEDIQLIETSLTNSTSQAEAVALIKSKYEQYSPATFLDAPADRKIKDKKVDISIGQLIYEIGCMHCHGDKRYSFFELDKSPQTFRYLATNLEKYTEHSIFQVGRYGTKPKNGKRAYMPQYTRERMSEQQMLDLSAYILKESGR